MTSSSRDTAHGFAIDAIMDAKDHKGRALAAQRSGDHGRAADEYAAAADAWRAAAAAFSASCRFRKAAAVSFINFFAMPKHQPKS